MNQPMFLLDIDGVGNAFSAWILREDPWMAEKTGKPYVRRVAPDEGYRWHSAAGYSLLIPEDMHEWIAEIEAAGFDMVHATMWQDRAVTDFGPVAGWGTTWDYIDFHSFQPVDAWRTAGRTGTGVGSYKWPGILAVTGDAPFIWVDDDMQPWQHAWAARRTASGIPTLFIQPDPAVGMTREHVDQVLAFARDLEPTLVGAH